MSILKVIKECFSLLGKQRIRFVSYYIVRIVSVALSVLPAYITSRIIAEIGSGVPELLISFTAGLVLIYVFLSIIDMAVFFTRLHVEKESRTALKKALLESTFLSFPRICRSYNSSKLTESLYYDANNVVGLLFSCADICVSALITVALAYLLVSINPILFLILLGITAVTMLISSLRTKELKKKNVTVREETDVHFKLARDILKNAKSIYLSDSIGFYLGKYNDNIDSVKRETVRRDRAVCGIGYLSSIMEHIWVIAFFFMSISLVSRNAMSTISFLLFYSFSKQFTSGCFGFISSVAGLQQTIVSVERVLSAKRGMDENKMEGSRQEEFPEVVHSVKFANLSFAYDESYRLCIYEIDIPANSCNLLIGKNGAGKTTILNLLCGVLTPDSGDIFINKIKIQNIGIDNLRKSISHFSQDDVLLDFSIRDNILSFRGGEQVAHEALCDICSELEILDDIMELEHGFDTLLSEAKSLSYGQKRKILLARTFLKPSQILLFDEPLEGLDAQSKRAIVRQINHLVGKKTVFIATHEPEMFPYCDNVLHLQSDSEQLVTASVCKTE